MSLILPSEHPTCTVYISISHISKLTLSLPINNIHYVLYLHNHSCVRSYTNFMLTREDDGEEEKMMNCLSIQREGKTMDLYMKEREGKPNADCQSRSPMPSTSAEPSSSPWGQARPMGASEAGGGRRGWWGQARPMGAVSLRAKSVVNTSQEPFSTEARDAFLQHINSSWHMNRYRLDGFKEIQL